MARAYIGLGSNLGNREANLRTALRLLTRLSRIEAVSSLYESEPIGPPQSAYCNAACVVETGLEPLALLRFLLSIEHEIGRRPGGLRWGPRPIDLDILLYDDQIVGTEELSIPHPRLAERAFALAPLAEIAPDVEHPVLGKTIREMAATINAREIRLVSETGWDGVVRTDDRVRL